MPRWESHIPYEKSERNIICYYWPSFFTQFSYIIQNADAFWTKPIATRGDGGLAAYVVSAPDLFING